MSRYTEWLREEDAKRKSDRRFYLACALCAVLSSLVGVVTFVVTVILFV